MSSYIHSSSASVDLGSSLNASTGILRLQESRYRVTSHLQGYLAHTKQASDAVPHSPRGHCRGHLVQNPVHTYILCAQGFRPKLAQTLVHAYIHTFIHACTALASRAFKRCPIWSQNTVHTEREFFVDNLLVQVRVIIVMNRRTGLAPWGCELIHTFSLCLS